MCDPDQLCGLLCPLPEEQVPDALEDLEPGPGNELGDELPVGHGDHLIVGPMDHQRGRLEPCQPVVRVVGHAGLRLRHHHGYRDGSSEGDLVERAPGCLVGGVGGGDIDLPGDAEGPLAVAGHHRFAEFLGHVGPGE